MLIPGFFLLIPLYGFLNGPLDKGIHAFTLGGGAFRLLGKVFCCETNTPSGVTVAQ